MADDAGIRFDAHDGAVEHGHRFAAGPLVGSFVQRQLDAIRQDAIDFHDRFSVEDLANENTSEEDTMPWCCSPINSGKSIRRRAFPARSACFWGGMQRRFR